MFACSRIGERHDKRSIGIDWVCYGNDGLRRVNVLGHHSFGALCGRQDQLYNVSNSYHVGSLDYYHLFPCVNFAPNNHGVGAQSHGI